MTLVSKWNGRNYYGYEKWNNTPIEVVKMNGRYYRTKYIIGEWLIVQGNPLTNFILVK